MRVFMPSHHERDRAAGAAGADLRLAAALEARGHHVTTYFYQDAFAGPSPRGVWRQLLFPWRVARHLQRHHRQFDIVDGTAGDLWLARLLLGHRAKLIWVARTHGLEHLAVDRERELARAGELELSWKFPLYHAGYRLWEVARDLRLADAVVFHNVEDREYAVNELGVPPKRIHVMHLGVEMPTSSIPVRDDGAWSRLLFAGSWIPRKGIDALVAATSVLLRESPQVQLTCIGTGVSAAVVHDRFAAELRPRIAVVPHYEPSELGALMLAHGVFVFPSRYEGFGLALVEAMAHGLVPVASRTGVAPEIVNDGVTGALVDIDSPDQIVAAVRGIAGSPESARRQSAAAATAARRYDWAVVAERREHVYASARSLAERARL